MQEGTARQVECCWDWEPGHTSHAIQFGERWPVTIGPTLGTRVRPLPTDRFVPCAVDLLWSTGIDKMLIPARMPAFHKTLRSAMPAKLAPAGARPNALECITLIREGVPPQLAPRIVSEPKPASSISLPVFSPALVSGLPDSTFTGALPASVAPMASMPKGSALPSFGFGPSANLKAVERTARPNLPKVHNAVVGLPAELALREVQPVMAGVMAGEIQPLLPTAKGLTLAEQRIAFPENLLAELPREIAQAPVDSEAAWVSAPSAVAFAAEHLPALAGMALAEQRVAFPENLYTGLPREIAQAPVDSGAAWVSSPAEVDFAAEHVPALPRMMDALAVMNAGAASPFSLVPIADQAGRPGIPGVAPAWPAPLDLPAAAVSAPVPVPVSPAAMAPRTMQQVAAAKVQLSDAETRPGWPEPAEAEIAAAASPDPVDRDHTGMYYPNVGHVSGLSLQLETAGLRNLAWRPVEPAATLAASASPLAPEAPAMRLPAMAVDTGFTAAVSNSQSRPAWPKPVQRGLAIARPMAPVPGTMAGAPRLQALGKNFELGLGTVSSTWAGLGLAPQDFRASRGYSPEALHTAPPALTLSLPSRQKLATNPASTEAGSLALTVPDPVQSMPSIAAFAPFRINGHGVTHLPLIPMSNATRLSEAGAQGSLPAAATPEPRDHNPNAAVLELVSPVKTDPLELPSGQHDPAVPRPGMIPIEFHCQRGAVAPQRRLEWMTPSAMRAWPSFNLKIAADKAEAVPVRPQTPKPPEQEPNVKLIKKANRQWLAPALKIAACLLLGISLWYGARELTGSGSARDGASAIASAASAAGPGAPAPESKGVLASVRRAISGRAATSVGDTLQTGMQQWGTSEKGWAPGWTRSAAGYVRTGELALFQPSLHYTDYRLEFFGQVENHGMGWAVRAQDTENYYAMKVTVIEAGLRPMIAMTHYPVVNGKKGHKVETPLSIMVHNNTPIHVAVDVQGNRLTASVEGQAVDSWIDEMMPAGGVGFFSEAGEHARLYWMKVSRNQDFLGTICSYLAGSSGNQRDTAQFWGPRMPADIPAPAAPPQPKDVLLAEQEDGSSSFSSPSRAKTYMNRRIRPWSS